MRHSLLIFVAAAMAASASKGAEDPVWYEARSAHFAVYSQVGAASARNTLVWFEQLHAFFERNEFRAQAQREGAQERRETAERPVRVVEFRSPKKYDQFRLHPTADAYYIGTDRDDFIVMPASGEQQLNVAAHEYAHLVFYRGGRRFPPWLNEGLADFFSSVHLTRGGCEIGGELPSRIATLKVEGRLPLRTLLSLPGPPMQARKEASAYYAESWALASMLILQPAYATHFSALLEALEQGASSEKVFRTTLNKSLDEIDGDLAQWIETPALHTTRACAQGSSITVAEASVVEKRESRLMLADLLLAGGDLERACSSYREALASDARDPRPWAALGSISLRQGNKPEALRDWQQAIDKGLNDASLIYRFAGLADEVGYSTELIGSALKRAIQLQPDFDDARYKLALLESNAGRYTEALEELQAMRTVSSERAFGYWTAYAYAATELGDREEAKRAAAEAAAHARNASEKALAGQLAYQATTDLTVQFSRTADGSLQMVTARKPHDAVSWNPFIESQDIIRREEGKLRSVECKGGRIQAFSVETPVGTLSLRVEDPQRVLMSNAPESFFCGAQANQAVQVEYAVAGKEPRAGYLRGMRFR